MHTTTLRQRNQATLPAELLSMLGLGQGDSLRVELLNGGLMLTPTRSTETAARDLVGGFFGAGAGIWGLNGEQQEQKIAEGRASWNR